MLLTNYVRENSTSERSTAQNTAFLKDFASQNVIKIKNDF